MRTLATAPLAALLVAGLAACGSGGGGGSPPSPSASTGTGGGLSVVATTTQAGDFARQIGGGDVSVTQLLKPGVDPHGYDPSPADVQAISKADVLVVNGVGLESWLDDAVQGAGFKGMTVTMSDGVRARIGGEGEGQKDPHIWQDPRNAMVMVANVSRAFVAADPRHAATYRANLAAYDRRLTTLDREIQRKINTIPVADRKVVTNHDAFGYYLDRYGLRFVGSIIPSFDTSVELSGGDVRRIVKAIENEHVRAVFSETTLPSRTAEAIASEAGVSVVSGEDSLYGDSLGPAGSPGATYVGAMEHNTQTFVRALGGSA